MSWGAQRGRLGRRSYLSEFTNRYKRSRHKKPELNRAAEPRLRRIKEGAGLIKTKLEQEEIISSQKVVKTLDQRYKGSAPVTSARQYQKPELIRLGTDGESTAIREKYMYASRNNRGCRNWKKPRNIRQDDSSSS